VAPRVGAVRIVVALAAMMAFEIAWWTVEPWRVGQPQLWLAGLGVFGLTFVAVRGWLVRSRARRLRRRLEARGLGIPRVVEVERQPWGLQILSDDGLLQVAWAALPSRTSGGYWLGPGFVLPDEAPVRELLTAPDEPPPMPAWEGAHAWTYDRDALAAARRANGAVDGRMTVAISVVVLGFLGGVTALVASRGGVDTEYALYAAVLLSWRLSAHLWDAWRWHRDGRIARPQEAWLGPEGLMSGVPGLVRTLTPWARIRRRLTVRGFAFFLTAGGDWHMVPRGAVPDAVEGWILEGREARRSTRRSGADRPAPSRDNPFEPPG